MERNGKLRQLVEWTKNGFKKNEGQTSNPCSSLEIYCAHAHNALQPQIFTLHSPRTPATTSRGYARRIDYFQVTAHDA